MIVKSFVILATGWLFSLFPPSFVFGEWFTLLKKEGVELLCIRSRTFNPANPSAFADEEVRLKRSGLYRKTIVAPQGVTDLFLTPKRAAKVTGNKMEAIKAAEALGPVDIFYAFADQRRLASALEQQGVDVSVSRWVLIDGKPALRIGTGAGSHATFSKEPWIPIEAKWGARTYRFGTADSSRFAIPYPEWIDTLENDQVIERTEVLSVQARCSLPDTVFDPQLTVKPTRKP